MPKKLLLIAEAVTLAHLARPLAISEALDDTDWSVTLACDSRFRRFLDDFRGVYRELPSIAPEAFLMALRRGTPLYNTRTLSQYVDDDLKLIRGVEPDLIVGDFRLSLSASARLAGVPYVAVANAYWSPFYRPGKWPVPDLLLTSLLPIAVAEHMFRLVRPTAFAWHSRPLNRVRRQRGLTDLGLCLRRVYTDADFVAYTDVPELFPISALPATHRFIGPALWEPAVRFPPWWDALPKDRPIIYVTLGSSGQATLLPAMLEALGGVDASVAVATASRISLRAIPPNVYVAGFVPGKQMVRRADAVICNGGSLTCYQALCAGVPIIGIAGNLDQLLNMQAIERVGAGLCLRVDRFGATTLLQATRQLLAEVRFQNGARRVSDWANAHALADVIPQLFQSITRREFASSSVQEGA